MYSGQVSLCAWGLLAGETLPPPFTAHVRLGAGKKRLAMQSSTANSIGKKSHGSIGHTCISTMSHRCGVQGYNCTHRVTVLGVVHRVLDRSTNLVRHLKLSVCPQEQVVQHEYSLPRDLGCLAEVIFLRLQR